MPRQATLDSLGTLHHVMVRALKGGRLSMTRRIEEISCEDSEPWLRKPGRQPAPTTPARQKRISVLRVKWISHANSGKTCKVAIRSPQFANPMLND